MSKKTVVFPDNICLLGRQLKQSQGF